jgi:hypothetical protein
MLSRSLKAPFLAAMRRLLRPIIRQLMVSGVTYPAFDRLVRELFVDVAETDLALPFKRQTDSRLSLLTGINRKEVAYLRRSRMQQSSTAEPEDSTVTHVIGRWMAGPPYATPDGVARRLPYEASSARAPSFARLTRDVVGSDIPVRSVLDELLRLGVAELSPEGDVSLRQEIGTPEPGVEGKLALLGSDPAELFRTIVHNIESPEAVWLQRKVAYDNIGADALPQLKEEARRLGEELMRRANALLASYDRDRNPDAPGGTRTRVVLGTYYLDEPTPQEAPLAQEKGSRPRKARARKGKTK